MTYNTTTNVWDFVDDNRNNVANDDRFRVYACVEDHECDPLRGLSPSEVYAAAIYWSIVTITSIGYGDITPTNTNEMFVGTAILLFGSCLGLTLSVAHVAYFQALMSKHLSTSN